MVSSPDNTIVQCRSQLAVFRRPEVLRFQNVRLLALAAVADDPRWLGDVDSVRSMGDTHDEHRFEGRSVHGAPLRRVRIDHGRMPYGITSSRRRATPAAAASADS